MFGYYPTSAPTTSTSTTTSTTLYEPNFSPSETDISIYPQPKSSSIAKINIVINPTQTSLVLVFKDGTSNKNNLKLYDEVVKEMGLKLLPEPTIRIEINHPRDVQRIMNFLHEKGLVSESDCSKKLKDILEKVKLRTTEIKEQTRTLRFSRSS